MKENKYLLNTLLTAVLFVALAAAHITRVAVPAVVLPVLNIPNMVLLSVIALLLDHMVSPRTARCYPCVLLLSAAAFGLLPLMAGFACVHNFWLYAVVGGVVFTVCTWIFASVTDRLASGVKAKAALTITAFGIYLASQCFAGMIL